MTRRHGAAEELRSRRALPPQTCPVRLIVGGATATATVTYDKFPTPVAHHATTMGTGAWPMATNVDSPDDRRHERDGPGDHHDTGPAGHPCPRRRSPCGARRRRRRAVSPFPATVSAARRPASRSPVPRHCVGGGAQVNVSPSSRAGCGAWQRGEARARDHAEHDAPHAPPCAVAPSPCDPARDRVDSALTRRATGGAHGPRAPVLARLVEEGTR